MMINQKVFLDDLPKWKSGHNKGQINWQKSIGYKIKFIYEDIADELLITEYNNISNYLTISYNDKTEQYLIGNFKKCKIGKLLNRVTNGFKIKIGQIFKNDKRDLIVIDREYREKKNKNNSIVNWKWYKYHCNKCGHEGWIEENHLLIRGSNCACCTNRILVKGINDIPSTAPWMVEYFQGGYDEAENYTRQSNKKLYFKCPVCNHIRNKLISICDLYKTHSIGCSCSDGISYPNKIMYSILEQLNIDFETEYSPNWIKPKRYDFYFELNNKKYIVEMDGEFHYKDNNLSGQSKEESKKIDKYKDVQAKENNIEVIRIDSQNSDLEYIKNNILNSELNNIFNLNTINWLQCEEFALSNICKKICDFKKDNPDMTTAKIGKIMKLDKGTIIKYLKKGTELGWCNYNSNEEKIKSASKNGRSSGKAVEISKDGILLGIFPSCAKLTRESNKLFKIKLCSSSISAVCTGKQKYYKGFTFKYV